MPIFRLADMEAIKEHDRVVLTTDVAGEKLAAGDVGTVVHVFRGGTAFEVEFVSLEGRRECPSRATTASTSRREFAASHCARKLPRYRLSRI